MKGMNTEAGIPVKEMAVVFHGRDASGTAQTGNWGGKVKWLKKIFESVLDLTVQVGLADGIESII